MKETDTITIRQLFDAFYKTFHNGGEVYFGGDDDDVCFEFGELLENLGVNNEEAHSLAREMAGTEHRPPRNMPVGVSGDGELIRYTPLDGQPVDIKPIVEREGKVIIKPGTPVFVDGNGDFVFAEDDTVIARGHVVAVGETGMLRIQVDG